MERYRDDRGNADSITANQPSSEIRDSWLNTMTAAWLDDLAHDNKIKGVLLPITSLEKRTLTHWRELTIKCGKKRLCIYPDGGFINEWNIARQPNGERYEVSTITQDTEIYLYRNKEIKFDIEIEEC